MVYVLSPDSRLQLDALNLSVMPASEFWRHAPRDPDCFAVDAMTYQGALRAFALRSGCRIELDAQPQNLRYSRPGTNTVHIRAEIVRGQKKVPIKQPSQLLEEGDIVVLSHLLC
jgi:hypothetical protein